MEYNNGREKYLLPSINPSSFPGIVSIVVLGRLEAKVEQ
jgi:hypothetical protein